MKNTKRTLLIFASAFFLCILVFPQISFGQEIESDLEKLMVKYEEKVLEAFQEMHALAQTENAKEERIAFDELLSGYTVRVMEIFRTLERIKNFTLENYKLIAARSLILRALANLEIAKTEGDSERIQKACEDYQTALSLTRGLKIAVLNQTLPYEIWIGDRLYTRLTELLDDKDTERVLLQCMRNSGSMK